MSNGHGMINQSVSYDNAAAHSCGVFFSSDSVCKLPDFYALSDICAVSPSRMVL